MEALGYGVLHGPGIAAGETGAERSDPNYRDVVLERRLREALARLNRDLPPAALEEAYRKLTRTEGTELIQRNRAMHRMLVDGVTVEYRRDDGSVAGAQAKVIDFDEPGNNDWLAVNQFTVTEGQQTRRPDVVLFVNGLPVAVIELKNASDENATLWTAFQQLQTYQAQIPALFVTNAALIVSDGVSARIGTVGAGKEWFKPWRTIEGRADAAPGTSELQVILEGVFEKSRFLNLLRHYDGLLCRPNHPASGDGEPDHRRDHGPQRSRRSVVRHLCPVQRVAAPAARAGRRSRRPARETQGGGGRRRVHDDPEVFPGGQIGRNADLDGRRPP